MSAAGIGADPAKCQPCTSWQPRERILNGRNGGTRHSRQLKNAMTSAPILGFPREEGLWYLDTDASDVGTGAVLSQIQDREERVIAYVSKLPEGSEQMYCTARKELLAVVRTLKHFKCYLYGQKISQDGQQHRELAAQE